MGWILLEAFVALVLAFAIVWWTTGAQRKRRRPDVRQPDRDEGQ